MAIQIRQIGPGRDFVGEVSGIDLTRPLSADGIKEIHAGMDRYAALVFHDQNFSNEQQLAFTWSLGPLEHDFASSLRKPDRLPSTFADVSNLDKDGRTLARIDKKRLYNLGNQLWHSDSSFKTVPAKYSLLHARSVTSRGGNTEIADMRQAWDALDVETRELCEPLICEHSRFHSRAKLGFTLADYTAEDALTIRPVLQRLVRVHQATGRKSLYLSAHAGRIVGWAEPEAKAFLMDLTEHSTQREFTYAHKWRAGDLLMWDNACTMHRARPYPHDEPRDMRRTTLAGDGPTVDNQGAWGESASAAAEQTTDQR